MKKDRYRIEFNKWPQRHLALSFRTMRDVYTWAESQGGLEDIDETRQKGTTRKQHLLRCATESLQGVKTIGFVIR